MTANMNATIANMSIGGGGVGVGSGGSSWRGFKTWNKKHTLLFIHFKIKLRLSKNHMFH